MRYSSRPHRSGSVSTIDPNHADSMFGEFDNIVERVPEPLILSRHRWHRDRHTIAERDSVSSSFGSGRVSVEGDRVRSCNTGWWISMTAVRCRDDADSEESDPRVDRWPMRITSSSSGREWSTVDIVGSIVESDLNTAGCRNCSYWGSIRSNNVDCAWTEETPDRLLLNGNLEDWDSPEVEWGRWIEDEYAIEGRNRRDPASGDRLNGAANDWNQYTDCSIRAALCTYIRDQPVLFHTPKEVFLIPLRVEVQHPWETQHTQVTQIGQTANEHL